MLAKPVPKSRSKEVAHIFWDKYGKQGVSKFFLHVWDNDKNYLGVLDVKVEMVPVFQCKIKKP